MGLFTKIKAKNITEQYFQMLDNFWSWTSNDNIYKMFRFFAPNVKVALNTWIEQSIDFQKAYSSILKSNSEHRECLYRAVALSYFLVMDLSNRFSTRDINDISRWMAEVLERKGYFDFEKGFNGVDEMIEDVDEIVRVTRRLEEWGDRRITLPDGYDGPSFSEIKENFVWGE